MRAPAGLRNSESGGIHRGELLQQGEGSRSPRHGVPSLPWTCHDLALGKATKGESSNSCLGGFQLLPASGGEWEAAVGRWKQLCSGDTGSGRLPWGCREESAEGVRRNAVAVEGPFGLIPLCFAGPRLTQT